jgi:hypothetical protein
MTDFETQDETYEQECLRRAGYYLQDKEVQRALEYLIYDRDMSTDEIKAAADLVYGWELDDE